MAVPHSSGTNAPTIPVPVGATDCHHHIFDARFPPPPGNSFKAIGTVEDYRKFKLRLGISRSVVIAAFMFGDDNSGILDAVQQFGKDQARAVAMIKPDAPEAVLDALHAGGVRGLRLFVGRGKPPTRDEMKTLGRRAADHDWHLQIVGAREGDLIAAWEETIAGLPCSVVLDHFGYPSDISDLDNATNKAVRRLVDKGRTYVKLSGVYIRSEVGFPTYSDCDRLAIELVKAAPERMLWGSDWPHTGPEANPKPDGAMLLDQLATWCPDEERRRRILVDNPNALYWAA